ncbi:MAG: hypothetical protein ACI35Z_09100 [Sphingobacterium hotanense]
MNTYFDTFRNPIIKIVAIACISILFTNCEKSDSNSETVNDGTLLKVNVSGIENQATVKEVASSSKPQLSAKASIKAIETSVISGDVEALMSLQEDESVGNSTGIRSGSSEIKSSSNQTKAANSLMGPTVKYRILIYTQDGTLVHNKVGNTGTDPVLEVFKGWTYKWYAFSINETAGVPNVEANGLVSKANLTNKDVLYASGTITTSPGSNFLNIVFKRKTANIQAKINVRGMFGTINDGTLVSLNDASSQGNALMTMGDLNPLTGTFTNISAVNASVSGAAMPIDNATEGSTVKVANFYTLNTSNIPASTLKVRLHPLKIQLDDTRERAFTSLSYTLANALTPSIGSRHTASLRLIESPILVKGIYWARTNLVYDANKLDKYRLKSNPGGTKVATKDQDFWNWMSATPTGAPSNVDACSKIYPEGTWKMPDAQTWQALGQPDGNQERMGLIFGADYGFFWNKTTGYPDNLAYDDNRLYISFGGYRTTGGAIQQSPAGLLLGLYASGQCHYWTSTQQNSTRAISVQAEMTKVLWGIDWGGITYPNADKTQGRNVRCIRAKNNPVS